MVSFGALAAKVFGSANDRKVKSYRPKVEAINALESEVARLSDADLRARTEQFRAEFANGKSLDELLVPAFATVREAAKRTLGQRHFHVQLIGGMALHQGKIAEMKTGEGKTLVATLAVYLNALSGLGVHVVTVNDYLASRDAEWMGQVYRFLGLTVGCIVHDLYDEQRKAAYACDVTYGTNNELGFDYLRDNMKMSKSEMVQRGHVFAIVDGVDRSDRRGAHTAHHFRPGRGSRRPLCRDRQADPVARQGRLRAGRLPWAGSTSGRRPRPAQPSPPARRLKARRRCRVAFLSFRARMSTAILLVTLTAGACSAAATQPAASPSPRAASPSPATGTAAPATASAAPGVAATLGQPAPSPSVAHPRARRRSGSRSPPRR